MATGKRLIRPLARWTLGRSRVVTFTAEHQREGLRSLGVDDKTLVKMPMGIHETFLEPPPAAVPRRTVLRSKTRRSTRFGYT
jgi:hypothetical protein